MKIKHLPVFGEEGVKNIVKHYQENDGVNVKYVCTSSVTEQGEFTYGVDIFYRDTPHPEFGNHYFGMYQKLHSNHAMITNADAIEGQSFAMVEDDDGNLQYSSHRHDYKLFENGNMIDGGRSYLRTSGCKVYYYRVENGEMKPFS